MSAEREILNETLPHWIRSRFGRWQVGARDVHGAISCTEQLFSAATSVEKIEPSRWLPNVQCIRRSHRRIVLRCPIGLESDRTCVVKLILLPGLKRKFWHRRYGLPEAVNLVQAHRCGIRVPQDLTPIAYWLNSCRILD